jgi:glycosyltransferase involved in cell wall biosynthesis
MKIRLISREAFHFRGLEKSNFWQKLIQLIYPKIDCIVCLNKDEETFFKQLKCTTAVIPNYVLQQNYSDAKREKILLTVCRLSFIKGADLIPAIAENIFRKIHDWKWIVIGNGELEETIRSEISRQKLAGQIELVTPGSCDIREYYEKASLYVSTSRFEAFPNVILEAMSYALSCVSYDCPTGPKHIISHNENGLLIQPNDVDAMANAIGELITNEEKRKALGRNAYQSISRFSPDEIYRLWDAVFAE